MSLRERVAGMGPVDRERVLLGMVRSATATVLGHDGPEQIDPSQSFLAAGFDSLSTVELRNVVNRTLGLRLPATALFDHRTPLAFARHLAGELATPVRAEAEQDTLSTLFREAVRTGQRERGFELLNVVADLRPSFQSPTELDGIPAAVDLVVGQRFPRLICVASPIGMGGPPQFTRFASSFRHIRMVSALQMPGFATGDRLPASMDTIVELFAQTVRRTVRDDPFVLVGYSAGGLLAQATASHLENNGTVPAGVVLLDSYLPGSKVLVGLLDCLLGNLFEQEESFGSLTTARLSAMSRYVRLLDRYTVRDITAPILFIRPRDFAVGEPPDHEWRASWDSAHTTREVSGDHFTMLEEHADTTARAVEDWLGSADVFTAQNLS
ncbi:MAG: alpha/beta fold hydrolase [Kutzneria sp.]|nr:alpha/beta fold hydrolase [Kutzneria sp.]